MKLEIEDLKKVKLEPGDTLVLTLPEEISNDALSYLSLRFKEEFPDNVLVILHPGYTLQVMAKETA